MKYMLIIWLLSSCTNGNKYIIIEEGRYDSLTNGVMKVIDIAEELSKENDSLILVIRDMEQKLIKNNE